MDIFKKKIKLFINLLLIIINILGKIFYFLRKFKRNLEVFKMKMWFSCVNRFV